MHRSQVERVASAVRALCAPRCVELNRTEPNELHLFVPDAETLRRICDGLCGEDEGGPFSGDPFYLVTAVGNDERGLEGGAFKLYLIFSHTACDLFLWLEYVVSKQRGEGRDDFEYPDIVKPFPAFAPFRNELADLLGLFPKGAERDGLSGSLLHAPYPPGLYPLRRDRRNSELVAMIERHGLAPPPASGADPAAGQLGRGEMIVQVGPVHAGVIEPGLFQFSVVGDLIGDLRIKLGYAHKGVERLFQSKFSLEDGWRLAECVAGDSSFAHSLAYCYAVERLAGREAPWGAELLRALFVELERLTNHVGDLAALAHDVSLEVLAADLAVAREEMLRLNARVSGHRLLRGLTRPGGIHLGRKLPADAIDATVKRVERVCWSAERLLVGAVSFRQRTIGVGELPDALARRCGATGFAARASGWVTHDARLQHPYGIYREEEFRQIVKDGARASGGSRHKGDVLARVQLRLEEVRVSVRLVRAILKRWGGSRLEDEEPFTPLGPALQETENFTAALGYVEGWRGDVVYWVMKDAFQRIFRCKVRDPSTLNWPALRAAVAPHKVPDAGGTVRTMLADFPLINKSFNLSYSGNDL